MEVEKDRWKEKRLRKIGLVEIRNMNTYTNNSAVRYEDNHLKYRNTMINVNAL